LAARGALLDDYDRVLHAIYEASLAPHRWDEALTQLVNRFGPAHWDVGMLVWEQLAPPGGRFIGSSGVNDMARHGYVQLFAGNNPWSIRGHVLPVGAVRRTDLLVPRDEFEASAFYRDFLRHYRIDRGLLASIDRAGDQHLGLCLTGPGYEGIEALEAVVRRLMPHLRRAALIARRINEAEMASTTALAALEATPSAVFLCSAAGQVIWMNPAASRLASSGVRLGPGQAVRALDPRTGQPVRQLTEDGPAGRCRPVVIRAGEEEDALLRCLAIRLDGATPGLKGSQVPAVMIVGEGGLHVGDQLMEQLRAWYGLTWAEARLAAHLALGDSLEDVALKRGISVNATRFLLKGIFAKTGTARQPALVARLRALPLDWKPKPALASAPGPA
jgi:DNA-binding CsgD family transcriptional regulator/PAS domain-containing protein